MSSEKNPPYPFSTNMPCSPCSRARKDEDHRKCTAVNLMVLKNDEGKPFLDFDGAKRNCGCFNSKPDMHTALAKTKNEAEAMPRPYIDLHKSAEQERELAGQQKTFDNVVEVNESVGYKGS